MTESKRIILNTLASYGKSIITLPLNLLSARWILQGLGADDFGLQGVVGGVVFFITFVSAVSSQAVSRFYAFAIGVEKKNKDSVAQSSNANDESQTNEVQLWFNTALSVHILLPVVLLSIGYPIGIYAIRHWLVIPPDRLWAAIWVFRLSLVTAFFSMLYVPYVGLYMSHQLITNLTVFTIITSICTAAFAYCFASFGGDRLIVYAIGALMISVVVGGIQVAYAHRRFPIARVVFSQMYDLKRMGEMLSFAWWRLLASLGWMLRTQGSAFLVNVNFGVTANAAVSVANQLAAQTAAFSAHLGNALMPAIVTSTGAEDREHAQDLVFRSCKFGTLLVLLFAVPIIAECDTVLHLWLKDPPPGSVSLCVCMILAFIIDRLTGGHEYVLTATGKMAAWQTWETIAQGSALLVGWIFIRLGSTAVAIGYAYISTTILIGLGRIYFARRIVQIGLRPLLRRVISPMGMIAIASFGIAAVSICLVDKSLVRFTLTGCLSALVLMGLSWFFVLDMAERTYITSLFGRRLLKSQ